MARDLWLDLCSTESSPGELGDVYAEFAGP